MEGISEWQLQYNLQFVEESKIANYQRRYRWLPYLMEVSIAAILILETSPIISNEFRYLVFTIWEGIGDTK